ncbi:MAG: hypothetical protein HY077_18565 [Elusimicrobia bacterium]|nr:hypothetical protein [Elusimicrobiota bacterium]
MRRAPRWVFAALTALALWHIALKRHGLALPLIIDEGEYSYEARLLAQGGLPYRDAHSPKPPLIFFLYRLCYAFSDRPESVRLLALAFSLATMALLFKASPSDWSWAARLAAPAAFGTLSAYPAGSLGFAANTELFVAFFMTAAAFCLRRSWTAAAGAAAGAALMTKPTCLWSVAAFGALCFMSQRRALLRFIAGACVAPLMFVSYFAARGGLGAFWQDALRRNLDYAVVAAATGAWRSQLGWLAGVLAPLLIKGGWPFAVLATAGLWGVKADRRRRDELLIVLWLGTALAGLMTGLFFFPHYFLQALPPLALACGLGVERLVGHRKTWGPALLVGLSLYPALVFARIYFFDAPEVAAKKLLYPNPLFESLPVADYIRKHSRPQETMYVFGSEPQLYVYAQRQAATAHITVLPLTMFPEPGAGAQELAALEASSPEFIVYCTQPGSTLIASRLGEAFRDGVRELLARRYRFVGPGRPDWGAEAGLLLFERVHERR